MRSLRLLFPALLASIALAACGGGEEKNADPNNTANNTTANNTTANNTTANNTTGACDNVTCDMPPVAACEGQTAVTYAATGTCTDGDCDYAATRTDCTAQGQSCMAGACVDIDDVCALVDCTAPAASCEGMTAVSYSGDGTCTPATGTCDFSAVEVRTDCTADGRVCAQGRCMGTGPEPGPGDLAITEIMANPLAVMDNVGEWFELRNATARELDLNGLTIKDDGSDTFAIPAGTAMLPAGGVLVLGVNDDTNTNGGVTVDVLYTGINLSNSADELVIVDANMVEIDRVAWDDSAGWIVPVGAAMQFGSDYDINANGNDDPAYWCAASSAYGAGDLGTPGADNGTCAPTSVTLYQLSNEADPAYPGVNATVAVTGVAITALDSTNGYMWLQETAGGMHSGIYVDAAGIDTTSLAVGDVIDIVGLYDEWSGLGRITAASYMDTGADMMIAPQVLESSALTDAATAESWENVLLQINEAGVTDIGLGFGEILVDNAVRVDDLLFAGFAASAAECQVVDSIVGVLNFSFGNFKLEPRSAADIGTTTMATAATAVTVAGFAFTPAAICVTAGDTVTWTNNDASPHSVTERLASASAPTNIPAMAAFDEALAGNGGTATVTFNEAGTFHYRCRPHPAMEGVVVVPNP